jgi:hypothetical protein
MAAFLCVTASVALLVGLVGLLAGHIPRRTGRKKGPHVSITSWSSIRD